MKHYLIIINGLPATGKTTLAEKLAESLKLPIFKKDDIKEALADDLNKTKLKDSYELGSISRILLNYLVKQLGNTQNYIIDSNFSPGSETDEFIDIIKGLNTIEIFLKADGKILFDRFSHRMKNRHRIHLEHHIGLDSFKDTINQGMLKPLNEGLLIEVDTTDFSLVDYNKIISQVSSYLAG